MNDHGFRYYLNKKKREMVGLIRLTIGGAVISDGYLIRNFSWDEKAGKFIHKREDMVPVESGERKLKWLQGNQDWVPVSTETAAKFIDYAAVPKGMR